MEKAYYTIGEISRIAGIKPYTLRYWESEFKLLRPVRRKSGHRQYSREDILLLERIKELLYNRRFTIPGAKKALKREYKQKPEQMKLEISQAGAAIDLLNEVKKEIGELIQDLKSQI